MSSSDDGDVVIVGMMAEASVETVVATVVLVAVATVVAVAMAVVVPKIDNSDRPSADDAPELHDLIIGRNLAWARPHV